MEFLIIGIALFFNIAFLKWKIERKRYADATLDFTCLVIVAILFSGSYGALVVGTIGSAMLSIYLYFSPPRLSL